MDGKSLIFDWNVPDNTDDNNNNANTTKSIEINDETLRDGLQAPGIDNPNVEKKIKIVQLISEMNINAACVGFPSSNGIMYKDVEQIIKFVIENKIKLQIGCAARTVEKDIKPIIELSQKYGIPLDANVFVATSPIRQYIEGWDIGHILGLVRKSVSFAVKNNINVCFITEDTTRSKPDDLRAIYSEAVEHGAARVCLCDTVGHATPDGTKNLIKYMKSIINNNNKKILIDWHGHNDRGLALANSLAAIDAGADRIHATGLGIGERTGNTSMEKLIINIKMNGLHHFNTAKLKEYCLAVSDALKHKIPPNYPIVGRDAYRTATGVHADAIIKAMQKKDHWLVDRVYSSVPARDVGAEQIIDIGPLSGKSNVTYWLEKNDVEISKELINAILSEAKISRRNLTNLEISKIVKEYNNTRLSQEEFKCLISTMTR